MDISLVREFSQFGLVGLLLCLLLYWLTTSFSRQMTTVVTHLDRQNDLLAVLTSMLARLQAIDPHLLVRDSRRDANRS
jgi:hypothetical protein